MPAQLMCTIESCLEKSGTRKTLKVTARKYVKINQSFSIGLRKIAPFTAELPQNSTLRPDLLKIVKILCLFYYISRKNQSVKPLKF
jgi:hypothetical protein